MNIWKLTVRRSFCRHGSCTFTEATRLAPSGISQTPVSKSPLLPNQYKRSTQLGVNSALYACARSFPERAGTSQTQQPPARPGSRGAWGSSPEYTTHTGVCDSSSNIIIIITIIIIIIIAFLSLSLKTKTRARGGFGARPYLHMLCSLGQGGLETAHNNT